MLSLSRLKNITAEHYACTSQICRCIFLHSISSKGHTLCLLSFEQMFVFQGKKKERERLGCACIQEVVHILCRRASLHSRVYTEGVQGCRFVLAKDLFVSFCSSPNYSVLYFKLFSLLIHTQFANTKYGMNIWSLSRTSEQGCLGRQWTPHFWCVLLIEVQLYGTQRIIVNCEVLSWLLVN